MSLSSKHTKHLKKYIDDLHRSKEGIEYLIERGLSLKSIEKFQLGLISPFAFARFDLLKGRISLPIYTAYGDILALAGRKFEPLAKITTEQIWENNKRQLGQAQRKVRQWERGKWINEPYPKALHLYNLDKAKNAIRQHGFAIVVEGYFDVIMMDQSGFENTVAVCGTTLTQRHCSLLYRYTDTVMTLLDGDEAGILGASAMKEVIEGHSMIPKICKLPAGMDPDDLIAQSGAKKLKKVVNYMVQSPKTEFNLSAKNAK